MNSINEYCNKQVSRFPSGNHRTSNGDRTLTETVSNEKKCDRILFTSR
ncbi:hypothetical protein GXM_09261 [Nostoc sphaeroides CCNUC1]|uniref:Uncharacterized protein n=1 Tax=Nostoc sphaeroides CCNUC1 TaxID=2653204 RepID=A0A5P8WG02_9NOSO|nr:hypothetical protein GXM_09261 [Nostoc sphaeroides CCNUC1]